MRDECLKLHSKCAHLKKSMDVVSESKVESKLINFPELKLSEADNPYFASYLCGCQAVCYYTAILMIGRRSLPL